MPRFSAAESTPIGAKPHPHRCLLFGVIKGIEGFLHPLGWRRGPQGHRRGRRHSRARFLWLLSLTRSKEIHSPSRAKYSAQHDEFGEISGSVKAPIGRSVYNTDFDSDLMSPGGRVHFLSEQPLGKAKGMHASLQSGRKLRFQAPAAAAASTTASALMLTRPRAVTEDVATWTGLAAPTRIGPMVTPPPRTLSAP